MPPRPQGTDVERDVVLSLGKLAPGQHAYYVDSVARGAEEYYTGAKEAPGVWVGGGSERLGLDGEVDGERLGNLLRHADPSGVWRLTSSRSVPTVAAFDATFCAPKSVSLLHALGDREVSNHVRNAADAAVRESARVLEQVACRVRRGAGGAMVLDGDGFVGAAFRHRTSRAGDPHLHTHVVIANVAHSPTDGRWTALDARALYAWAAPVGYLFEAQLRWELTRRLGVDWGPVKNGIADIDGIGQAVLREFSTRRREIEAHLAQHGQSSARAAQFATYATRRAKDRDADLSGQLPEWRARAEAFGLDADTLAGVLDRASGSQPPMLGSEEAERLFRWLASPDGLTASQSTFGQRDVIKAVCNQLPSGAPVGQVLDLVDGFLRSEHVLPVRVDERAAVMYRRDGTAVASRTDEYRWTTPEMLEAETRLLEAALGRRETGVGIAEHGAIQTAVQARSLTGEQARMVQAICSSGDGVEIVEGVAGAGKTYALAAARDAWTVSGCQVIGCSLAARAARQLEDDAGIPSVTIDRLLTSIARHATTFNDTTVLVVDEAAMVGTRTLARLLTHAETAGAKVVLVGDPCQLPEIEAGGTFAGLQHRLGASRMTENRRQTAGWERATLAELRAGDPNRAFDDYLAHDRIHHATSDEDVRKQLVDAWMTAHVDGEDVVMVAARLAEVDDLNRRARHMLRDEGRLGDDRVRLGGRPFTDGDTVLALRNDYRLGILNGTWATVERIDTRRHELTLTTTGRHRLVVPFAYAEAGHLAHGYATTIHKAQGATVDRCYVLADAALTREHAYTALSRGRHGNDLYVVAPDRRTEEAHAVEVEPDQLDALRHAIARSGAKRMAIDQDDPQITRVQQLRAERDEIGAHIGYGPPNPSSEYSRLCDEIDRQRYGRDNAEWRLDNVRRSLDDLGPVGRLTRRAERHELEHRIDGCTDEIDRHEQKLADLEQHRSKLEPAMQIRDDWEAQHRTGLDRLDALNREITITEHLDQLAHQTRDHGIDDGIDIGM